MLQTNLAPN